LHAGAVLVVFAALREPRSSGYPRRMRRRACLLLPLLAFLAVAPALARGQRAHAALPDPRTPGLSTAQRLDQLLQPARLEQPQLRRLAGEFVQQRQSALLVASEESRGSFYFAAPDKVRWAYRSPNPMQVVIDRQQMLTWYQDLGRADRVKVGRYAD